MTMSIKDRAAIEQAYMAKTGRKAAILGVSGGVDSTAMAAVCKEAAPDGTIALLLPCSSDEELKGERAKDIADGQRVADHLAIPAVTVNLSELWQHATALYTQAARDGAEKRGVPVNEKALAWATINMKATLRMMSLGFFADAFEGMIYGTDNAIENFLGYFSIRGDGVADRQPIRDCTKAEVRALAATAGFPEDLVIRKPTAGLWPGQTDEDELGFSYDEADRFFLWLLNQHVTNGTIMSPKMTVIAGAVDWIVAEPTLPVSPDVALKIVAQNIKTDFKRRADDLGHVLVSRGLI